jgi:hypothetical protein
MRKTLPVVLIVLVLAACGGGGDDDAAAPAKTSSSTTVAPAKPTTTTTAATKDAPTFDVGTVVLPSGVADPSAVVLDDGRVRLYFGDKATGGIGSAISTDGRSFEVEPGVRVADVAQPFVMKVDDGWRMYFKGAPGSSVCIGSAHSDDGLAFSVETGARVPTEATGFEPDVECSGPAVLRADDGWHMWFSSLKQTRGPAPTPQHMITATSADGLTWKVDTAVALGEGGPLPKPAGDYPDGSKHASAEHPSLLVDGDTMWLYFGSRIPVSAGPGKPQVTDGLHRVRSTDGGRTFSDDERIGLGALDSSVVRVADETLLFYGGFDEQSQGSILVSVGS